MTVEDGQMLDLQTARARPAVSLAFGFDEMEKL